MSSKTPDVEYSQFRTVPARRNTKIQHIPFWFTLKEMYILLDEDDAVLSVKRMTGKDSYCSSRLPRKNTMVFPCDRILLIYRCNFAPQALQKASVKEVFDPQEEQ